jgi:hypothetical protein
VGDLGGEGLGMLWVSLMVGVPRWGCGVYAPMVKSGH